MTTPFSTPTWTIGPVTFNADDANGVRWGMGSTQGWYDVPDVRTFTAPMPRDDGLYRSQAYKSGRPITLNAWVQAPSLLLRDQAHDTIVGLPFDGGQLQLVVAEAYTTRTAMVELVSCKAAPAPSGGLDIQLVLSANDPRKYDLTPTLSTTFIASGGSGLNWTPGASGTGLDWVSGGGLNWGTVNSPGAIQLPNAGKANTWPIFTLVGPLSNPVLTNTSTGQQLAYTGVLGASDVLVLTSNPLTRSVLLNTGNRRLNLTTAQWFSVPRTSSLAVTLATSSSADTGSVTGSVYSAWW